MKKELLIFGAIILLCAAIPPKDSKPEITIAELKDHISYLASDKLKGRQPGTPEDKLSAEYIKKQFVTDGCTPLTKDGFQYFEVVTEAIANAKNVITFNNYSPSLGTDFTPYNFSASGSVNADVVFAGYGFALTDSTLRWNDYQSIDVKGKWVMVLRADPELEKSDSKFIPYSNERSKVLTAKDNGAAGVLFVTGVEFDKNDKLVKLEADQTETNMGIPVFHIKRDVADKILNHTGNTIAGLESQMKKDKSPNSFDCKTIIAGTSNVEFKKVKTQNVIYTLKGNDKVLKNEYVVIGAHFDHLGMGGPSTSSRMPDSIAVHHGADDNASGVASILEIAQELAANKKQLKRSVIFIAFGAEEIGSIGSKYFITHPLVEKSKIKAMINIDMVGRLKDTKELLIGGSGTSVETEELLTTLGKNRNIVLSMSPNGFGPSDHSAFYAENIPVFFFSTGAHSDYHTPKDVVDQINFEGLKVIDDYIYDLSQNIINREKDLTFQEAGPKGNSNKPTRGSKVKLGIMPNFGKSDVDGLRVDGVTPGSAAFNGGIKKGDVIVAIEGKVIHNIYEYMSRMEKLKPGQTISIDIIRDNKKEVFIIHLIE